MARRPLDLADHLLELIAHLAPELKKKVRFALDEIENDPGSGKPLSDELQGYRSYKLGQWRIIYQEKTSAIEIVSLGPRRTIYQKVVLEIRKRKS